MLDKIDLQKKLPKASYKETAGRLELRLDELQREARSMHFPILVVFEGWSASGKGTLINKLIMPLDPRGVEVHRPANPPTKSAGGPSSTGSGTACRHAAASPCSTAVGTAW
jgi:polyphosphate kinase 2 (PPK2 family)